MIQQIRYLICILIAVTCNPLQAENILIGAGNISGNDYALSSAICRVINRNVSSIDCSPYETPGSISNLANVQGGSLELGIVRSDQQYHAVSHSGPFEFVDTPYDRIRALFSLHVDPFTIVARMDSGILHLDDLKGRRVNIGNPGSRQRQAMDVVMKANGWLKQDFQLVTELPTAQHSLALCHNRVQAIVSTEGHPNPAIKKALKLCNARLVDLSGHTIDRLVKNNTYYGHTIIPAGLYGQNKPIKTFGLLATVVSSADVDPDLIYQIVKGFFENLDTFLRMHKLNNLLTPQMMITQGVSAPIHKGAMRYYREQGWME